MSTEPRPELHRKLKWIYWAQVPPWLFISLIADVALLTRLGFAYIGTLSIIALAVGESANEDSARGREEQQ